MVNSAVSKQNGSQHLSKEIPKRKQDTRHHPRPSNSIQSETIVTFAKELAEIAIWIGGAAASPSATAQFGATRYVSESPVQPEPTYTISL